MTSLPNQAAFPTAFDPNELRDVVLEFLNVNQTPGGLSQPDVDKIISGLPQLTEKQVVQLGHQESVCPICFVPLLALLAEEETAIAMDSPAHPMESLGVTRLAEPLQCNHIFCRRDITRWVRDGHDSCPTCRRPLLERNGEVPDATSPRDAYDPALLQDVLQHIQYVSGEGSPHPILGTLPTFLFSPARGSTTDNNEYNAMYS
ncbi:hypothetical protein D9757_000062 [Collybiopsis confluens]|uniref:RING-type domain-containing protein n=1 Tax=Collybiopsis confluens TaxID=2823264 RepID=A0A8H5MHA2_9AGAR|nr:hypothetical protein D9757_000062 [Collybiopsis confluens]